ncbi:DUF317 domain-containing protein [Kitasatospora sp. A2-31]|uniref:DUF317 domain-containing protein n=1 Tax=Kitasatospora sp. A2-31 TaxID=2916414 RepID=UPI001EEAD079|nr:DUF317 domain-containing protein [Kitasatospora sp. A2-31]MCG6496947.1 DUF317 domain-containing protein [Kitasatospora sp. A2-31]
MSGDDQQRDRRVAVAPRYVAGWNPNYHQQLRHLREQYGWSLALQNRGEDARSPCSTARVFDFRWATRGPALTIEVTADDHSPLWKAAISRNTPGEILLPVLTAVATAVRDEPAGHHGRPRPCTIAPDAWEPLPGWRLSHADGSSWIHEAPDSLACLVVRSTASGPSDQEAGYSLHGGPGDSPRNWTARFSPTTPHGIVAAMYQAVAAPEPLVRFPEDVPPHHWPYAVVTALAPPEPARSAAAALRSKAPPPRPAVATTAAGSPPPKARHRTR